MEYCTYNFVCMCCCCCNCILKLVNNECGVYAAINLNNREYYCCEDRYINNLGSIAPHSIFVHIKMQLRLSYPIKIIGSKIENLMSIINCSELSIIKCIRYSLF